LTVSAPAATTTMYEYMRRLCTGQSTNGSNRSREATGSSIATSRLPWPSGHSTAARVHLGVSMF
jgi:hypothetical protein